MTRRLTKQWLGRFAVPIGMASMLAVTIGRGIPPAEAGHLTGSPATYTLDADFDEGLLINVAHSTPDQLQLDDTTTTVNFVWVAVSARGTIVRIDVNTGAVLGEYLSAPDFRGRNPSRTTVDNNGNVWVANRDEFEGGMGSVTRVGLVENGQCDDRDGSGTIETSTGLGDIRPWTNAGGADDNGGVSTAEDECIINYTRVTGTGTRTVAVDANNDVWVGGLGDRDHEKLDGITGLPVPGTQFNAGCGGYGGLVDPGGTLWSAQGGSSGLLRFAPNASPPPAGAGVCLDASHGDYGLGIDPITGHIWHTNLFGDRVAELDAAGNVLNAYTHGNEYAQGVVVDVAGNVWVAHSLFNTTTVGHLRTDGTFVGNVPLPGGNGPTGVAVDGNGKVWVANINTDNVMRIDPSLGPIGGGGFPVGAVDLTVDLGPGASPYNYSDMTGSTTIGAPNAGTWTIVHDSGLAAADWSTVSWNADEPGDSSITVKASSSEDGVLFGPEEAVTNGMDLAVADGRYLKVVVSFARSTTTDGDGDGTNDSPILFDVTIRAGQPPDCSAAVPSISSLWPPNHQFAPVNVLGVIDPDGDAVSITIDSIFQDERVDEGSTGNTSADGMGVGTSTAEVRAERAGSPKVPGNGRVYHISFTADDGTGGTCSAEVLVSVPHDQGGKSAAIDDGPLYDSTVIPACGMGAELVFLLPPLMWMYRRRRA